MICYLYTAPKFLFFSPDVPALLYYAQIPGSILALIIGFYIFWHDKESLLNRLLLAIVSLFFFWIVSTLIAWTNINSEVVLFFWSFFNLILGLISIFCIYFIYVFLNKKDVTVGIKIFFLTLLAPILLFAPTFLNLSGFNITNCDAFDFEWFPLKLYATLLGILAMAWIAVLLIHKYRNATTEFRKQIVLMGTGIELFLFSFFGMEFLATYFTKKGLLPDSGIELYGLFGMVIFMIYISILVVRFGAFHIKLLATQALVWGLVMLIGAQFFFVKTQANLILNAVTFIGSIFLSHFLIRSVKQEIRQRESIEKLAEDLRVANEGQTNLIHIINHQVKGYIGKGRNIFAELGTDSYGKIPEQAKVLLKEGLNSLTEAVSFVQQILNASNVERGTMTYTMKPFDFRKVVSEVTEKQKTTAEQKDLEFNLEIREGEYAVNGDESQLKEAVRNLIDNSINYTPKGKVEVSLEKKGSNVLLTVKDTGIGINEEDKKRLFTKGGRGKDSLRVNVNSTGYGLSFVKGVVTAHKGRVWAESEGPGKGSTFYLELPTK